jgi:hypothetical protein
LPFDIAQGDGVESAQPLGANQGLAFTPLAGAGPLLGNRTISVAKPLGTISVRWSKTTCALLSPTGEEYSRVFRWKRDAVARNQKRSKNTTRKAAEFVELFVEGETNGRGPASPGLRVIVVNVMFMLQIRLPTLLNFPDPFEFPNPWPTRQAARRRGREAYNRSAIIAEIIAEKY